MTEPDTWTLEAPGATLTYDVRANGTSTAPPLLLVGSPMDATYFGTLAGHFTDRTVVTYDPRGAARSKRTDGAPESTPEEHADDLRRVIVAVGGGPVDVFASSGGAVNGLVLVAKHPECVRILVAHEPPASQYVEDRAQVLAACVDIRQTYLADGYGPAFAKFIHLVSHQGPVPDGFTERPVNPADFGLPTEDDGTRDDPVVGQNVVTCNHYEHDLGALRAAPTRVVVGVGAESGETLPARTARAVAERLDLDPVVFPGDHVGFHGGPEEFAAALRRVLEDG